jgi:hypothetical protein
MLAKRWLKLTLVLLLAGGVLWGMNGFTLIPLRIALHAVGLSTGYHHCPPTGNVFCTMAEAILSRGCALLPSDGAIGQATWSMDTADSVGVWDATSHQESEVSLVVGIGECGGLLHSAYDAFLELNSEVYGGPTQEGSAFKLEPDLGSGMLSTYMDIACTTFYIVYHLPGAPLVSPVDQIPVVMTFPHGDRCDRP